MWHMGLRLPWTWRLGPSNSSERGHVMEMLEKEEFPENTLFCGDAGTSPVHAQPRKIPQAWGWNLRPAWQGTRSAL